MTAALITVLLAVGAVAYVAWPLFGRVAVHSEEDPEVDVLRERQEAAVEALRELDYERQIGKLTDAEYFPLRERYARQAMALLKVLDQREAAREAALERAIAARRAAGYGAIPVLPVRVPAGTSVAGGAPARSPRRWLIATGGGMLALVAAVVLLVATVDRGTVQPAVVGTVPLQTPHALAFDPSTSGRLLAGGANGLMASSDGGKSWVAVASNGLPSGTVSLFPAIGGSGLMALDADGSVLQSNDGGQTWRPAEGAPALPRGTQAVAEVPGAPPVLVVATPAGMRASSDNGKTWAAANGFVNGLLPTNDDRDVVYAPTADQSTGPQGRVFHGLLFVATDKGLFASADDGRSWLARSLGGDLVALAVDPQQPSSLIAMNAQGQLFRSQDAGVTWER